jgi:hypothetical protein
MSEYDVQEVTWVNFLPWGVVQYKKANMALITFKQFAATRNVISAGCSVTMPRLNLFCSIYSLQHEFSNCGTHSTTGKPTTVY